MNIFHKVTLQSLKKNRTRTVVTIIGIILSAAMICAVTTLASSIRNYAIQYAVYSVGNWYGRTLGTDFHTYETVRDSDKTEGVVYLQQLGYAVADGCENEFKPYIYLLGAGKGVNEVLPIHMTSGRYPTSSDEILLPNHLYTNGGIKHSIGDKLTLSLGQRVLDGDVLTQNTPCYINNEDEIVFNGETLETRERRTYTVVGFYDRLDWRIENFEAPGYTALTVADKELSSDSVYDVYFRTKHPGDIYAFMENNHLGDDTNSDVLMFTGTFKFDNFTTMLYSMSAIVIGLIMFGSVALIYNAFSISVSERTKQFGLLSSIGATKKQLRRMVLFEALTVSAIGIPIGILGGVGGIGITLLFIGNKFHSLGFTGDMKLSVSPASILTAAVVALITVLISAWIPSKRATKVSAIEAIRQNMDVTAKGKTVKTSRIIYALFGLPGVLASKHYKRNRKKYRTTVLSLFMSIVLFVSASAFTEYLMETVSGGFESVGYDLLYQAAFEDFDKITPDELLNRIKAAKSVTGVAYARERFSANTEIRSEYLTEKGNSFLKTNQGQDKDDTALDIYLHISFVDDGTYKALLKKHGLSEEKFINPEKPLALALDGITKFNVHSEKYETVKIFNRDEFEVDVLDNKEIPGYTFYSTGNDSNGNTVCRYIKEGTDYKDGDIIELAEEEATERTKLNIGKVITERPDFIRGLDDWWFIYPISLSNAVFENFDKDTTYEYYFTIKSGNHTESNTAVKTVLNESGFNSNHLYDFTEQEESERNMVAIIRVFSYGFIVLISLIAAANVFNTISTNISLRRREFAMLKSVGMTRKGFNRMMNFECLLYGSRALLYGLPVSCGITWLIYQSVMSGYETTFHLPWGAIGIAVLSVFLVVFVTMMYAMSKVKKDNPIDALRNENL